MVNSSEESPERLFHLSHRHQFYLQLLHVDSLHIILRQDKPFESKLLGFTDTLFDSVYRTDFTEQPDFTCHTDFRFDGGIHIGRKDGTDNSQVDGRVVHLQPPGNI